MSKLEPGALKSQAAALQRLQYDDARARVLAEIVADQVADVDALSSALPFDLDATTYYTLLERHADGWEDS